MRGLSTQMIYDLKNGFLSPFLHRVKTDNTLDLQIRNKYFNIYYRGGSLILVSEVKGQYYLKFESKYLSQPIPGYLSIALSPNFQKIPILNITDVNNWLDAFPFLKNQMDLWFGKHPKNEREFQQNVVRENNYSPQAKGTDYFILDIEYTKSLQTNKARTTARLDLVACKWISSGTTRKTTANIGLSFIEMKYGDGALSNKAGIISHVQDLLLLLKSPSFLPDIQSEMISVFKQKLDLGLITNQKYISSFDKGKPEFIFLIANHDPDSKILIRELNLLINNSRILTDFAKYGTLRFSAANFHGYGLYQQNVYSLSTFLTRFQKQIG